MGAADSSEFIFTEAPFASCDAPTIVEWRNGDGLSAWSGGSGEGNPDVAIWASRRNNGKWSTPADLARDPAIAAYNPVLFYTKDNRLTHSGAIPEVPGLTPDRFLAGILNNRAGTRTAMSSELH